MDRLIFSLKNGETGPNGPAYYVSLPIQDGKIKCFASNRIEVYA